MTLLPSLWRLYHLVPVVTDTLVPMVEAGSSLHFQPIGTIDIVQDRHSKEMAQRLHLPPLPTSYWSDFGHMSTLSHTGKCSLRLDSHMLS